jgi:hypothetical protein
MSLVEVTETRWTLCEEQPGLQREIDTLRKAVKSIVPPGMKSRTTSSI